MAMAEREANAAIVANEYNAAEAVATSGDAGLGPGFATNRGSRKEEVAEPSSGKSTVPGVGGMEIDAACGPTVGIKCGQKTFNNGWSADSDKNGRDEPVIWPENRIGLPPPRGFKPRVAFLQLSEAADAVAGELKDQHSSCEAWAALG